MMLVGDERSKLELVSRFAGGPGGSKQELGVSVYDHGRSKVVSDGSAGPQAERTSKKLEGGRREDAVSSRSESSFFGQSVRQLSMSVMSLLKGSSTCISATGHSFEHPPFWVG